MSNAESSVNVFDATLLYLDMIFNTYDKVCLHLSGGKNSTVLLYLMATVAKVHGKKFTVLFIDREAQYALTVVHLTKLKQEDCDLIDNVYWIALPMTTVNEGGSCLPEWLSWEEGLEWWRTPPVDAIVDKNYFPFYRYAMNTEDFIAEFSHWLASDKTLASLVGTNEGKSLSHSVHTSLMGRKNDVIYPLSGWQVADIWLFNNLSKAIYNPLYDLAYRSGKAITEIKILEPFESNVWQIPSNPSPVPSKDITANQPMLTLFSGGTRVKQEGHTWCSYVMFLLNTMPRKTAEFYRQKITSYFAWYQARGYPVCIPDEEHLCLVGKDVTSWETICTMILENDYRARTVSILPNDTNAPDNNRKKSRKGRGRGNEAMFL